MRCVAVLLGVALHVACSAPCPQAEAPPEIDNYRLDCDVDEDCALVSRPNCSSCACAETPLRAADADRYVDEQTICCGEADEGICDPCLDVVAICADGECAAGPR